MTYEYRLEEVKRERTDEIKKEKDRIEALKKAAYEAEEREIGNRPEIGDKPTPQQS